MKETQPSVDMDGWSSQFPEAQSISDVIKEVDKIIEFRDFGIHDMMSIWELKAKLRSELYSIQSEALGVGMRKERIKELITKILEQPPSKVEVVVESLPSLERTLSQSAPKRRKQDRESSQRVAK